MAKKKMGALALSFSPEQKQALKAAGFDWSKLLKLLQNPLVKQIVIQLIDLLLTPSPDPQPAPVFGHDGGGDCDHKACCLAVLQSSLRTACLAAQHYDACCCEE